MDRKLISWAYAVKARRQRLPRSARTSVPPLWVFSDPIRLPDPSAALLGVPKGLCGLVLRNASTMDPACLQRTLAVCRARRFPVTVVSAGPGAGASLGRVGRHFPGKAAIRRVTGGLVTAAAHDATELLRARRGRVDCVFLSPVFATRSHPGAGGLGVLRRRILGRRARIPLMGLGGLTGQSIRLLNGRNVAGAGVIGALLE